MSSTFQQWNPTGANQETDAQYLVDAQRLAGSANPSIWTSQTANKFLYQASTFYCALCDALAAKGLVLSDASRATLAGVLANIVLQSDLASALALYAPLVSAALVGAPTTTTPPTADNSTRIADTAWVKSQGYLASITAAMVLSALGFTPVQQGGGAGQSANKIFIGWDAVGGKLRAQVDASDFGDIAWESDLAAYMPRTGGTFTGGVAVSGAFSATGEIYSGTSLVTGGTLTASGLANLAGGAVTNSPGSTADSTTSVANTFWVQSLLAADFPFSFGGNGWQRLASGLIIQWGNITAPQQTPTLFNFPRAFPNACYLLLAGKGSGITAAGEYAVGADVTNASQFTVLNTGPTPGTVQGVHYIAIGA
jgi:hypothetical protein